MKKLIVVVFLVMGLLVTGSFDFDCALAADKQVFIGGGRTTSPWYAFSQALAKFINDKSTWLKAQVVSTAGISGNLEMMKKEPKKYIGISSFTHIHARPGHEWGEKRGAYTGERFIVGAHPLTNCFMTYDPKIKTIKDLAGKTVDVGRKGAANTPDHLAILKIYGVLDKVKLVYSGMGGGAAKLKDGLVDATLLIINHTYPDKFSKGGFVEKLQTRGPVYYVGVDRDKQLELMDKQYATIPVRVPPGTLDKKTQPKALWVVVDPLFFSVDESMDEDIVYEITRVAWETPAEEWAKWNPMGAHMNEKFKPAMPSLKYYKAHPGAKKYYDEKGIKLRDLVEVLR